MQAKMHFLVSGRRIRRPAIILQWEVSLQHGWNQGALCRTFLEVRVLPLPNWRDLWHRPSADAGMDVQSSQGTSVGV
jgi:hypothetical protein